MNRRWSPTTRHRLLLSVGSTRGEERRARVQGSPAASGASTSTNSGGDGQRRRRSRRLLEWRSSPARACNSNGAPPRETNHQLKRAGAAFGKMNPTGCQQEALPDPHNTDESDGSTTDRRRECARSGVAEDETAPRGPDDVYASSARVCAVWSSDPPSTPAQPRSISLCR